jgi:hypothetical protein
MPSVIQPFTIPRHFWAATLSTQTTRPLRGCASVAFATGLVLCAQQLRHVFDFTLAPGESPGANAARAKTCAGISALFARAQAMRSSSVKQQHEVQHWAALRQPQRRCWQAKRSLLLGAAGSHTGKPTIASA